ncbi:hypothetical protein LTR85_008991 [Meristemomyces frigidus]|nr:hypothetical protein LTR85_008991 [Meristemomyces frigidus]
MEVFDLQDPQDEDRIIGLRAPFWSNNVALAGAFTFSASGNWYIDTLPAVGVGLSIPVVYRPFVSHLHVILPLGLHFANTVQASAPAPNHFGLPHMAVNQACSVAQFPQMTDLKLNISFSLDDITDANNVHPPLLNSTIQRVVTAAKSSGFAQCQVDAVLTDANHGYDVPEVVHSVSGLHAAAITTLVRSNIGKWHTVRY